MPLFTEEEIQSLQDIVADPTTKQSKSEALADVAEIAAMDLIIKMAIRSVMADTSKMLFDPSFGEMNLIAVRSADIATAMYLGYRVGRNQNLAEKLESEFSSDKK